jgi:hypothetical protein
MRWLIAVGLACVVSAAHAQPAQPSAEEVLGAEAFAHYRAGRAHYDVQDYAAAIAEFRAGYLIHQHPLFVFAIAKAQQKHGDCTGSIESLRRFIRTDPGDDWVAKASSDIAACEAQLRELAARDRRTIAERQELEHRRRQFAERAERSRRRTRLATTTGIVGVAVGGFAAFALTRRLAALDDARQASTSTVYLDALDRADAWTGISIGSGVAGGALIATSLVLWLTAPSMPDRLTIAPTSGGAMLVFGGRL